MNDDDSKVGIFVQACADVCRGEKPIAEIEQMIREHPALVNATAICDFERGNRNISEITSGLSLAMEYRHLRLEALLLRHGADPHLVPSDETAFLMSPVQTAIDDGFIAGLRMIRDEFPDSLAKDGGNFPKDSIIIAMHATKYIEPPHTQMLAFLVDECGLDIKHDSEFAMKIACKPDVPASVLKFCLERGCNPDRDFLEEDEGSDLEDGAPRIHVHITPSALESADEIMGTGIFTAIMELQEKYCITPLMTVAYWGDVEKTGILLDYKANPLARNKAGLNVVAMLNDQKFKEFSPDHSLIKKTIVRQLGQPDNELGLNVIRVFDPK